MRPKRYILLLFIVSALALSVFTACEFNRGNLSGDVYDRYTDLKEIQSFQFHIDDNTTNTTLTYTVSAQVTHDPATSTYRLAVPYPAGTDLTQLTPRFSILGDNLLFTSNEATPLTTTLTSRSTIADFSTAAGVTGDPPAMISVEAENNTLLDYEFYLREDIVPAISPNVSFTNQRTNDPSVPFTVIFNRPINDASFNAGDIITTLGYVSGKTTILSQREYNFYVNYDGTDGLVTVSIPRGRVQGAEFGLDNSASNTPSFYFDRTGPEPGNWGDLTFTGYTTDSISLEWTAAVDNFAADVDVQYKVFVSEDGSPDSMTNAALEIFADVAPNFPRVLVDWTSQNGNAVYAATAAGLTPGRYYHFLILVKDDLGNYRRYNANWQRTIAETEFFAQLSLDNPLPITINEDYSAGSNFYFTVSNASDFQSFRWYLNGHEIIGQTGSLLDIPVNETDFDAIYASSGSGLPTPPFIGNHVLTSYAITLDGRIIHNNINFSVVTN